MSENPSYDAPPEISGLAPGSRPAAKVLVISDTAGEEDARHFYTALSAVGMQISVASQFTWQVTEEEDAHDVVLLNVIGDMGLPTRLASAIRSDPRFADTSIVARLDTQLLADSRYHEWWADMRASGVDDFIPMHAYLPEIEARFDALAAKTQLARELRATREELSRHLQYDEVTQLLNRRFFFKAAHRECARARRYNHSLSCLMVDLDYLILYNQNFGYTCGDYLLRTVANILRQWTRDSDVLARFSGTKFVLLLPETNVQGAMVSGDKLQQIIGEAVFSWQGQRLPLTVSIGDADRRFGHSRDPATRTASDAPSEEPQDDMELISVREELAELLADADAALFVAKRGARYPSICVERQLGFINVPNAA